MRRIRVSLSLSEGDFLKLSTIASSQGKLPTSLASDVVKSWLLSFDSSLPDVKSQNRSRIDDLTPTNTQTPVIARKRAVAPKKALPELFPEPTERPLSRQERRAKEREEKKKVKKPSLGA